MRGFKVSTNYCKTREQPCGSLLTLCHDGLKLLADERSPTEISAVLDESHQVLVRLFPTSPRLSVFTPINLLDLYRISYDRRLGEEV